MTFCPDIGFSQNEVCGIAEELKSFAIIVYILEDWAQGYLIFGEKMTLTPEFR